MSTLTKITTATTGLTLTAAIWNDEFDQIYSDYNGGITNANISGSAAIAISKISTGVTGSLVGDTDTQTLTNKTLTTPIIQTRWIAKGEYDNENLGATPTIDWSNGDRQTGTVNSNTTLSFSDEATGQIIVLRLVENGTGGYTITLPSGKWPAGITQTFTTTANAINLLTVYYDGTNFLYNLSAGFA